MAVQQDVTGLLRRLEGESAQGRKAAYDQLFDVVYNDLRDLARRQFARQWSPVTLQPTALVHEAYGRLIDYEMNYENRAHFMNVAAAAMRRLLIEQARSRNAAKRWGHQQRAPLEEQSALVTLSADPRAPLLPPTVPGRDRCGHERQARGSEEAVAGHQAAALRQAESDAGR
jgi:RNA polymerase sigma factor (TIGR02999 family)